MKNIKIEWCENFIKATFKKLPKFATGIETNLFFKMAENAGLYIPGTYGSPMSQALGNLTTVETVQDANGNYAFAAFHMKEV